MKRRISTKNGSRRSAARGPLKITGKTLIAIAALIILVAGGFAYANSRPGTGYDEFAQCLTEKGAVMYGAYWCSHCKAQKRDFGEAFQYINYVECTEDKDVCTDAGIKGFPSWVIDGKVYSGRQPLERLAELTQCELPE
ncbi:hypothetical protein KY362_04145 [Candidatus Woesearchaeota archaeon]|nr:hypothetical protein [Candidatus Woesearchaeota archaeon]